MPKRTSPSNAQVSEKLAAKVRAAGLRTAQTTASRGVQDAAATLERLRDDAAALGQYNAAVQAERIRAQIFGAKTDGADNADLSGLDDATLRARLDAALAEMKRLAPKTSAQAQTDNAETPDIFG